MSLLLKRVTDKYKAVRWILYDDGELYKPLRILTDYELNNLILQRDIEIRQAKELLLGPGPGEYVEVTK